MSSDRISSISESDGSKTRRVRRWLRNARCFVTSRARNCSLSVLFFCIDSVDECATCCGLNPAPDSNRRRSRPEDTLWEEEVLKKPAEKKKTAPGSVPETPDSEETPDICENEESMRLPYCYAFMQPEFNLKALSREDQEALFEEYFGETRTSHSDRDMALDKWAEQRQQMLHQHQPNVRRKSL